MQVKDVRTLIATLIRVVPVFLRRSSRLPRQAHVAARRSREQAVLGAPDLFIAHASHELRTPLATLKTRLYLLRRQPERMDEHLQVLDQVADQMAALVDNLLELARLPREIPIDARVPVCAGPLVRGVIAGLQAEAEGRRIVLAADLPPVSPVLYGDPGLLARAVRALIADALARAGECTVLTIRLDVQRDPRWGGYALLYVGGTPEIAPDRLVNVFDPFWRPTLGDVPGDRLELALCRRIVEAHGGVVAADNTPDAGSVFTLGLPLASAPSCDGP